MTDSPHPSVELATLLSRASDDAGGSIPPPIVQSSLFSFDSYEAFEDRMAGRSDTAIYTRVQNPTVAAFEAMMASAEHAEAAVGFASGMGAISATVLSFVEPGDVIVCVEHVYPDAYRLFERVLRPFGVDTRYYPMHALETDPSLLEGAKLAYLESPNSVMFQTLDIGQVAAHAKQHGVLTVIDNSWATPVFQQPLNQGIDIVVHSASKYISGHSDTVAGVVCASQALIQRIRDRALPLYGAKLAPFEAWLLIRGLRTLVPRMHWHQKSAREIATRALNHPAVSAVHYPLHHHNSSLSGTSGLLSLEVTDDVDIRTFCNRLTLFRLGVSWGGFESLALPAGVGLAQAGEANSMQRFGVPPRLIRLSIGLEHLEDLWQDVATALDQSRT